MIGTPDAPLSGDAVEHVSAAIAQGVPLDVVLDLIMQRTCDLLEMHQAAFFLGEEPRAILRLTAASTGILAQHGGRIWAESQPDSGTRFHVTLPERRQV